MARKIANIDNEHKLNVQNHFQSNDIVLDATVVRESPLLNDKRNPSSDLIHAEDGQLERNNNIIQEANDIFEWFHRHVLSLTSDQAEWQQVRHLHENVLPTLRTYRRNVEEARKRRRIQRTWGNGDVLFFIVTMLKIKH